MNDWRKKIDSVGRRLEQAKKIIENETADELRTRQNLDDLELAQTFLVDVGEQLQNDAHHRIADIVSSCLGTIWDEPYTFRIDFERKRGKTEAVLRFEKNGKTFDPMSETGGGVIDVGSFALRLAALLMSRPHRRKFLVLDEPFKFVSKDNLERVGQLLRQLANDLDVQLVIVTHIPQLHIGKVVELPGK